jgi:carboxyl-terminal processing protease
MLQKKLDTGLSLAQAETKLSTTDTKTLSLTVSRPGEKAPLTISVATSPSTVIPPVESRTLPSGVGYIKVNQLSENTADAFDSALATAGTSTKGLILDLRDATGTSQEAGAAIAGKLSTVTTLGYQVTKGDKITPISVTPAKAVAGPVVVLINGGTAHVAELLASALRDGGAKLIGSPTFGDDTDVKRIALRDGSGFTMTIGRLETTSKTPYAGVGIKPDIIVPDIPGTDAPLDRATTELSGRLAQVP